MNKFEQLFGIHQIKIPRQTKLALRVHIRFNKWVTIIDVVAALRSVTQMPHHHLAQKTQKPFHESGMLPQRRLQHLHLLNFFLHLLKNIGNALLHIAADAFQKRHTGRHPQFHGRNPRPVLSAVVLLFHHQVKLVEAIQRRAVLLVIKRQGFPKSKKGNTTFVAKSVRHRTAKVRHSTRHCQPPRRIVANAWLSSLTRQLIRWSEALPLPPTLSFWAFPRRLGRTRVGPYAASPRLRRGAFRCCP